MPVDLSLSIPTWTDGVDHWRQIDVSWLRDRSILRLPNRSSLGASAANAGQTIFSSSDQGLYFSANTGASFNWKSILASSKLTLVETGNPEIHLSGGGSGSGITWQGGSTIVVTNLVVSGSATIGGALTANSLAVTTTASVGGNLTVGGSQTIQGNLTVSGTITGTGTPTSGEPSPSTGTTATTAQRLATPRTISLSGGATGSTVFDGSQDVTINVTLSNVSSASVANSIVRRDGNGSFSASTGSFTTLNISNGAFVVSGNTISTSSFLNVPWLKASYLEVGSSGFFQWGANGQSQYEGNLTVLGRLQANGTFGSQKTNITGSWDTAQIVADGGGGPGNASIALRAGNNAAQLRLGTAINDLYFRNFNDSGYITCHAGTFVSASSVRYKHDIRDLALDAVSVVRKLRPVSWKANDPTDTRTHIGFTAEDLAVTFPQAVVPNEEGQPDGLENYAIETLSLVAIQQLLTRIEELEKKIDTI